MSHKRAAAFGITHEFIRDVLKLPSGLKVTGLYDDFDRMMLKIRVGPVSPTSVDRFLLPVVKPGELIPLHYIETNDVRYFAVSFRWWFILAARNKWNEMSLKVRSLLERWTA